MSKSWKDRPGKKGWNKPNYKQQKRQKKWATWDREEPRQKFSSFDDSQEYHQSFA